MLHSLGTLFVVHGIEMKQKIRTFTKFSAYWLAFCLLLTGRWIAKKFGEPSFEQVIYHLQFGSEGLLEADKSLALSFVKNCILAPTVIAAAIYGYEKLIVGIREQGAEKCITAIAMFFRHFFIRLLHFVATTSHYLFRIKLPIILLLAGVVFLLGKVSFWSYLSGGESDFIEARFVTPKDISAPKQKRNLLLIYVESLEASYSDRQLWGKDLVGNLNQETVGWANFRAYRQAYGTGWTMAGIVSTQCGIPLKPVTLFDRNRQEEHISSFLPNAICMGDVLLKNGYKNVFMGGASLSFAGKGKFLEGHGYTELWGKEDWEKAGEKEFHEWGIYDDALIAQAKKKLDALSASKQPFNLTVLTVDTHQPYGFASKSCRNAGVNDFTGIVTCSTDQVASLIKYARQKGYDKNTDIVVLGDHLVMTNPVFDIIERSQERFVYNKFFSSQELFKNREQIYHFDVFPSIMSMLGFSFEEGRLGLGVSGFGKVNTNDSLNTVENLDSKLSASSKFYLTLWKNK